MKKAILLIVAIAIYSLCKWAGAVGINYEAAQGLMLFDGNGLYGTGFTNNGEHTTTTVKPVNLKTGTKDVLINKTASNGAVLWTKIFVCRGSKTIQAINQDTEGNIYVCGTSTNGFILDLSATPIVFTPPGAFICKISENGRLCWSRSIGDHCILHSLDASGNSYVAGYFSGTYNFDPGNTNSTLIAGKASAMYLLVLDSGGQFVSAKHIRSADMIN